MACLRHGPAIRERRAKQFQNKPIASHQLVQDKLVYMITEISKSAVAGAATWGKMKDQGTAWTPTHVSMLKMNNVWIAMENGAQGPADILGANGIVDDYCIMRPHEQPRIGFTPTRARMTFIVWSSEKRINGHSCLLLKPKGGGLYSYAEGLP